MRSEDAQPLPESGLSDLPASITAWCDEFGLGPQGREDVETRAIESHISSLVSLPHSQLLTTSKLEKNLSLKLTLGRINTWLKCI